MEFDKSKVYTALNADELKVGSKVILADSLECIKHYVKRNQSIDIDTLVEVREERFIARFFNGSATYNLAYLVSEPEEKKLKWTDLKIGDVITNGRYISMVTKIDKDGRYNSHIYAGDGWIGDSELEEWVKVEE